MKKVYMFVGIAIAFFFLVKHFGGGKLESDKDVCGIDTEGIVWEAPPKPQQVRGSGPFRPPPRVNVRHAFQRQRVASLKVERAYLQLALGASEREAARLLESSPEVAETETGTLWRFNLVYNMGGIVEDKQIEILLEDGQVVDKSCRFTDPEGVLKRRFEARQRG